MSNASLIAKYACAMRRSVAIAPIAAAALLLGACSDMPKLDTPMSLAAAKPSEPQDPNAPPMSELDRAIEYWGKEYKTKPRDLTVAINYVRNLRAAGRNDIALAVMQEASVFHASDRRLASEYGRLALEMNQTSLAQRLLETADDPAKPDWKIVSARGTIFAKQGNYKQAIPFYERALELSPNQPSVVSNLAMAYAADGDAPRAEGMLRRIAEAPDAEPKIRQNLALVLSLQGKYDEARAVGAKAVPADAASANVEYVRQMVRLAPQSAPKSAPAIGPGVWMTNVVTGSISSKPSRPARSGSALKPSQE